MRDFATTDLGLPDNGSYRSYVQLDRRYVVWNVIAAPEFSLRLREWCFLVVGCVRYRGYYHERAAQDYGNELRSAGEDVYIQGVDAYSTLGWFDDPMLSTLLRRDEAQLAGSIFHELAHQQLFITDDTAFNEGFAKTVELEGVRRWLQAHGSPQLKARYEIQIRRERQFVDLVRQAVRQLGDVYASKQSTEDMRDAKAQVVARLRDDYARLKTVWQGYDGYDGWFSTDLNNAKLGSIGIYQDYVPAFQQLLTQNQGDLRAFYRAAQTLGHMSKTQRVAQLDQLSQAYQESHNAALAVDCNVPM